MEATQEQGNNNDKRIANLLPYQFKKGQSGNPGGRPKGSSMKVWVQNYLASLDEEERLDFLEGQSKTDIWKMGEGNPESKSEVSMDMKVESVDPTDPVILASLKAIQEKLENE